MTTWLILACVVVLSGVLLWGLIAPRSQWRVLFGWSTHDPDASEPGDGVHGLRRALSALGLLGVLAVGGLQLAALVLDRPIEGPEPTALDRMWGTPTPRLVDRVVVPTTEVPERYIASAIDGYQALDRGYPPNYLADLPRFSFLGEPSPSGLVGSAPVSGFTGYGSGDLIVSVDGPLACIPRLVVATETELIVQLGVFWGLPGAVDQDHAAGCDLDSPVTQTVLVPVQLTGELGDRLLVSLDGVPLSEADDLLG